MAKILLTGGGTAGHVTPNIALLPTLKEKGYDIAYMGSYDGIEKKLIEDQNIPYIGISSGKLRRYMSLKNFTDPFRVIKGFSEAKKYMKEFKPDVVFSKGGFVSVPVVFAAKKYNIPVIIHESDMTPGLANKLSIPKAKRVCHNFPETKEFLPKGKSVLTGSPIRKELLSGNAENGKKLCGFDSSKPVLIVMGGSLGAGSINTIVRECLDELLKSYQIVHLCGTGKLDKTLTDIKGYKQFEYVKSELKDLFAMCDLVVSRAGANAICEIQALKKPSILIPLSAKASRGDQIDNAKSFKNQGFSEVIEEENLTKEKFMDTINYVYKNKDSYISAIEKSPSANAIEIIVSLIDDCVNKRA